MRIALWHDPPSGGARRAIEELTSRLASRHTLDIFRLDWGTGPVDPVPYARRVEAVPFQQRPHRRGLAYWNDWLSYQDLIDLERLERELAARIDGEGYDLVLTSVFRLGQAPALLRYLRAPSIYYCHEPIRRFYEPWCRPQAGPMSIYERGRRLWRWPTQTLLDGWLRRKDQENVRSANLVLTNSRYTQGRIKAVYGCEAKVSYLGVDAHRFRPAAGPTPPGGVISVGSLEAHKGFDFVLRSLGRIPAHRRPALTMVGSGGRPRMPSCLRLLAQRESVSLSLCSGVSDEDLVSLYQANSLFLFGAHHEPFGLVVLEAMACGLPVVAVAEGGVVESVRNGITGCLVPRDEEAFAAAVDSVLSSEELRRAAGCAARRDAVDRWSWEDAVRRLERQMEGVASPSQAPVQPEGITRPAKAPRQAEVA